MNYIIKFCCINKVTVFNPHKNRKQSSVIFCVSCLVPVSCTEELLDFRMFFLAQYLHGHIKLTRPCPPDAKTGLVNVPRDTVGPKNPPNRPMT